MIHITLDLNPAIEPGHVKTLFEGMNLKALKSLWDATRYGASWEYTRHNMPDGIKATQDLSDSAQQDFYRQMFSFNMVRKIGGYYGKKTLSEYTETLRETVKTWGVKLPKSVGKLAQKMDEEIAAVTAETEQ